MTDANLSPAAHLNEGRLARTRHTHDRDVDIFNSDDTVRRTHRVIVMERLQSTISLFVNLLSSRILEKRILRFLNHVVTDPVLLSDTKLTLICWLD